MFAAARIVLRAKGYKRSPALNEAASSSSARATKTLDGDRRWPPRTLFAEDCVNLDLNCDHVHQVVISVREIESDLAGRHAELRIRADGTRYAG